LTTPVGHLPDLHSTVTLVFAGDDIAQPSVFWEPVSAAQVAPPGTVAVRSLVDSTALIAEATVTYVP
jgi:hypothetical protein